MIADPDLARAFRAALERGSFAPAEASRVMRALAGLSQREFADQLGLNLKVIRSIESGRGNPNYESLARLAAAADLRVAFVGRSAAVDILDPAQRIEDERRRRQADAYVPGMHERNALRVDDLAFELPKLG